MRKPWEYRHDSFEGWYTWIATESVLVGDLDPLSAYKLYRLMCQPYEALTEEDINKFSKAVMQ